MITDNHAVRFACSLPSWPVVFAVLPTIVRDTCSSLSMLDGLGARLGCAGMAQQMLVTVEIRAKDALRRVLRAFSGPLQQSVTGHNLFRDPSLNLPTSFTENPARVTSHHALLDFSSRD